MLCSQRRERGLENHKKFLILYLTCCLEVFHKTARDLVWPHFLEKFLEPHLLTAGRRASPTNPAGIHRQSPSPSPEGYSHAGAGFSSRSGPLGYKHKGQYSPEPVPLVLSPSLLSSVTVKRQRM